MGRDRVGSMVLSNALGLLGVEGEVEEKHKTVMTKKNQAQNLNLLMKGLILTNPMSTQALVLGPQPLNLRMKKPIWKNWLSV